VAGERDGASSVTILENLSAGQAKLERIIAYLRQQKREAIAANDAAEVWNITESLTVIQKLQRVLNDNFMEARKTFLRRKVVEREHADAA
jgi:hypothetical protein